MPHDDADWTKKLLDAIDALPKQSEILTKIGLSETMVNKLRSIVVSADNQTHRYLGMELITNNWLPDNFGYFQFADGHIEIFRIEPS